MTIIVVCLEKFTLQQSLTDCILISHVVTKNFRNIKMFHSYFPKVILEALFHLLRKKTDIWTNEIFLFIFSAGPSLKRNVQ